MQIVFKKNWSFSLRYATKTFLIKTKCMISVTFSIEFMQFGMQKEHYKGNHKASDPDNTFV